MRTRTIVAITAGAILFAGGSHISNAYSFEATLTETVCSITPTKTLGEYWVRTSGSRGSYTATEEFKAQLAQDHTYQITSWGWYGPDIHGVVPVGTDKAGVEICARRR